MTRAHGCFIPALALIAALTSCATQPVPEDPPEGAASESASESGEQTSHETWQTTPDEAGMSECVDDDECSFFYGEDYCCQSGWCEPDSCELPEPECLSHSECWLAYDEDFCCMNGWCEPDPSCPTPPPGDTDSDGDTDTGGDGDGEGDTDTDTNGDGDGDGDPDTGDPCWDFTQNVFPIPPSVLLLLDRSSSMMQTNFDLEAPDASRWQSLHEALAQAVLAHDQYIAFGAKTFSSEGQELCGVSELPEVELALANAELLLADIPGPLAEVDGGRPTRLALDRGLTYMDGFESAPSTKFIVLVTDGRIGCLDPEEDPSQALADALMQLEQGTNLGVSTYVLGLAPGDSAPLLEELGALALAGGAPKPGPEAFYRADDPEQLGAALEALLAHAYGASCSFELDDPPFFPEYFRAEIGPIEYELVDNCETEDGFVFTDPSLTQVQLCGIACDDFRWLGIGASVDFNYWCG